MSAVRLFLAVLLAAALPALATPQTRNATDIWLDPNEPGWGLNVVHQGGTLFATLFVYGPDGQPKWYVASNLKGGDDGVMHDRPSTYTGGLYEASGPYFGGPFNQELVTRRQVGTMTFEVGDDVSRLIYSVDGVQVTKQVRRFTFRRVTLDGYYEAYIYQPAGSGASEVKKTDLTLQIRDDGTTFSMDSSSDSEAPCTWTGTQRHDGQFELVSGSSSRCGPFSMKVDPSTDGFTGSFTGYGATSFWGRIAAARFTGHSRLQGFGWRNDMWWAPNESGWGLNVIEQGNTLFGTLFVFDAQQRPRWYVASNLTQQNDTVDGTFSYTGALTESTGPWFGTAFDPAAVTRRTVGQMTFRADADGKGQLTYSVDGVQVSKQMLRFAFDQQNFSGTYFGSFDHDRQAEISISDTGSSFQMQLVDLHGGSGTCTFKAPFYQVGSVREMAGTYSCTGGTTGTFHMSTAAVSFNGFTARFDSPLFNFRTFSNGHIGGVRREAN